MVSILARYASRFSVRALDLTVDSSMLWVGGGAGAGRGGAPGVRAAPAVGGRFARIQPRERQPADHRQHDPAAAGLRGHADRRLVRAAGRRQHAAQDAARAASGADRLRHAPGARDQRAGDVVREDARSDRRLLQGSACRRITELPGVDGVAVGTVVPWRDGGNVRSRVPVLGRRPRPRPGEEDPRGRFRTCRPDSSPPSACRSSPDAISTMPIATAANRSSS